MERGASNIVGIRDFKTPVGELVLGSFGGSLCLCDWKYRRMRAIIDARILKGLGAEFAQAPSDGPDAATLDGPDAATLDETERQLSEYFAGDRKTFELPLLLVGSDFQKAVWAELARVPYGTTESYAGLAKRMGRDSAVRGVAAANGANAIAIIIPCHRIIGSNGDLTGYAGGLTAKRRLLELESAALEPRLPGM